MVHVIRPQPPAQPSAKLQVRPDLVQTLLFRHAFLTAFLGVLSFLGQVLPFTPYLRSGGQEYCRAPPGTVFSASAAHRWLTWFDHGTYCHQHCLRRALHWW